MSPLRSCIVQGRTICGGAFTPSDHRTLLAPNMQAYLDGRIAREALAAGRKYRLPALRLRKKFKKAYMWEGMSRGRKALYFLAFADPSALFFIAVAVIPLVYGAYLTFTDWSGISLSTNLVGLDNYVQAFKDTAF